jgi:ABC-type phosphate transport system substrate-binding protein
VNDCNQKTINQTIFHKIQINSSTDNPIISISSISSGDQEKKYYLLFEELINIVTNKLNPLYQLDIPQINNIYNGVLSSWQDVILKCPTCFGKSATNSLPQNMIQPWIFIPGSTSQKTINDFFLDDGLNSLSANIAPDEQAMAEAIALNPSAIGFLPSHWLNEEIKIIQLMSQSDISLKFPVLVSINPSESQKYGPLILCIQSELRS